jgi:SanA protein
MTRPDEHKVSDYMTAMRQAWPMARIRRILLFIVIAVTLAIGTPLLTCWAIVSYSAAPFICKSPADVGDRHVAVLLCTKPRLDRYSYTKLIWGRHSQISLPGGWIFYYYERANVAGNLYANGCITHILISGQPDDIASVRAVLLERGIPGDHITCDSGSINILSAVVRARDIYGLHSCTFIAQRTDAARAVYLARAYGMDAVAWSAPNPSIAVVSWKVRQQMMRRCLLGSVATVLDKYITNRHPHADGEMIFIPGLSDANATTQARP